MCQSLGVYLSTSTRWPFVFLPIVPLVLIAMVIFIALPDSPTSSLQRTGDVDKVRRKLRDCGILTLSGKKTRKDLTVQG